MKNLLAIAISVCACCANAQKTSVIIDSKTGVSVPYVHISASDADMQVNATGDGKCYIPQLDADTQVNFSAVGYATAVYRYSEIKDSIFIDPQAIVLDELSIVSRKRENKRVANPIKKAKNTWMGAGGGANGSLLHARYIPYAKGYEATPFLEKVRVKVDANKDYTFNLRIYAANADTSPGEYLVDNNILVAVKKGQRFAEADLSKFSIKMPDEGIVIALEHIAIKANRLVEDSNEDKFAAHMYPYGPLTLCEASDNPYGWTYINGTWSRNPKIEKGYAQIVMELTLTD